MNNEKTVYETRIGTVRLERFEDWKQAVKSAKQEIIESEYDGMIDIFQIKEQLVTSIKKQQ